MFLSADTDDGSDDMRSRRGRGEVLPAAGKQIAPETLPVSRNDRGKEEATQEDGTGGINYMATQARFA